MHDPHDPDVLRTPADLFANVPGVLGFYPEESIVLLCLDLVDPGGSRHQLGPVLRVDIDDVLRLHFTPEVSSELILALIVSKDDPTGDRIATAVTRLTQFPHIATEAIWHTPALDEEVKSTRVVYLPFR